MYPMLHAIGLVDAWSSADLYWCCLCIVERCCCWYYCSDRDGRTEDTTNSIYTRKVGQTEGERVGNQSTPLIYRMCTFTLNLWLPDNNDKFDNDVSNNDQNITSRATRSGEMLNYWVSIGAIVHHYHHNHRRYVITAFNGLGKVRCGSTLWSRNMWRLMLEDSSATAWTKPLSRVRFLLLLLACLIVSLGYNCCMSDFLTKLLFYMVGFSFSFRIEW